MTRRLIAVILALLLGYGLLEAWPLLRGPVIHLTSPENNASFPDGTVSIAGTADHIALLTLNGAPLLHDQNGNFSSTLTFPRGGSILTVVATDRFGRHVTQTRTIFVP